MTQPYLTSPEAAGQLGVSVRTVHRMAADGRLPVAIRLSNGKGLLFDPDVVTLIRRQRQEKAQVTST